MLKKIGVSGFSCYECGNTIKPDDYVEVCSDCGAVFCKECSENNALKHHDCDE